MVVSRLPYSCAGDGEEQVSGRAALGNWMHSVYVHHGGRASHRERVAVAVVKPLLYMDLQPEVPEPCETPQRWDAQRCACAHRL